MMRNRRRHYFLIGFLVATLLIDLYFYPALWALSSYKPLSRIYIYAVIGFLASLQLAVWLLYNWPAGRSLGGRITQWLIPSLFITYVAKFFGTFVLFVGDILRFALSVGYRWMTHPTLAAVPLAPRSLGLIQATLVATALPLIAMGYGIAYGAHAYRIRRVRIALPHLPASFHGITIAQLSDIHSGSFFNTSAVARGVDMLLAEKPAIIFFTGDLVNNTADEIKPYIGIFSKLKAELGVYSVLGNHDYGDYIDWPSPAAKAENLNELYQAHAALGWRLLRNEHHILTLGGEQIAILGVENWGRSFSRYGKLGMAYRGVENMPVKLLLSHDPSHWDGEVRPQYGAIDVTFSGHTHGFQFGIEIGSFKWSPVQYQYKQWAGLYQQGSQYLYVNRGFGYIGYPGRIGIWPEITIITLEKGDA
jgi:predicted MPP superfamily phosphohydrolase